jgi:AraC-like DNA-binding protein
MAKPERAVTADTHFITLAVPRAVLVSARVATDRLHGLIIPVRHAVRLAGALMSEIGRANRAAANTAPSHADADLIRLLAVCLSELGLARAPTREKTEAEKLRAAQRFIKNQLVEETLCPNHVARALNLSRATLYRLFEESDGVRKYIQTQRLARLKLGLSSPSERRSVGELAHEAGFVSEHHANRSFKQEFGVPPGEFRREMRISTQTQRDHGDVLQTLVDWLHLMR